MYELTTYFTNDGKDLSMSQIEERRKKADGNKDGLVDFDEFIAGLSKPVERPPVQGVYVADCDVHGVGDSLAIHCPETGKH